MSSGQDWLCTPTRDVSSADLVIKNQQGIKAEIEARADRFSSCIDMGQELLARGHYAAEEVGPARRQGQPRQAGLWQGFSFLFPLSLSSLSAVCVCLSVLASFRGSLPWPVHPPRTPWTPNPPPRDPGQASPLWGANWHLCPIRFQRPSPSCRRGARRQLTSGRRRWTGCSLVSRLLGGWRAQLSPSR